MWWRIFRRLLMSSSALLTARATASLVASLDELCMIVIIWLDPRCATDEGLDRRDLYRNN